MRSEIRKPNHFKSEQKRSDLEWFELQPAIAYGQPFEKKFEFCMVGFQIPTVIMHNIGLQRMTLKFFSVHGGKRRRPFSCDKCDKKFGFRSQLVKHANFVHTDERKFHCIICNVKVKTRTILKVVTTCHFHIFLFLWT